MHPVTGAQHAVVALGVLDLVDDGAGLLADLLYGEMLIGHIFDFHGKNLLHNETIAGFIIQGVHIKYNRAEA